MDAESIENEDFEKSEQSELTESMEIRKLLEETKNIQAKPKKAPREIIMLDDKREKSLLKTGTGRIRSIQRLKDQTDGI